MKASFEVRGILSAIRLACLAAAILVLPGCATTRGIRYSEFAGMREGWPTSAGAAAETAYYIPVYMRDWPERPYEVIGQVRYENPRTYWNDDIIGRAALKAGQLGGDAVIVPNIKAVQPFSWLDQFTTRPTGYGQELLGYVIKWIPEEVVRAREQRRLRFWQDFRAKHKDLASRQDLVDLAAQCLEDRGVSPLSGEMGTQLTELLTRVLLQDHAKWGGTWLVKGNIHEKRLTSTKTYSVADIVSATEQGGAITIVSTGSRAEISVNGTVENGKFTGTIGVGLSDLSASSECEGVAVPEKISVSFRSLAASGVVEGNLVFLR